jgi:hypothetical protein
MQEVTDNEEDANDDKGQANHGDEVADMLKAGLKAFRSPVKKTVVSGNGNVRSSRQPDERHQDAAEKLMLPGNNQDDDQQNGHQKGRRHQKGEDLPPEADFPLNGLESEYAAEDNGQNAQNPRHPPNRGRQTGRFIFWGFHAGLLY